MCIIVDINVAGDYANDSNKFFLPLRNWVDKKGVIIYSETKKFKKDMKDCPTDYKILLNKYSQKGAYKLFLPELVETRTRELIKSKTLKSDDPHVIALAQLAKVDLLATNDNKLIDDFKNSRLIKNGKVYSQKKCQRKSRFQLRAKEIFV